MILNQSKDEILKMVIQKNVCQKLLSVVIFNN
jgi:hypothetical protein